VRFVTATATKPTLWHIGISHYSEKVRWALDFKGVEHERRAPQPPAHMVVALARTRGRSFTFPLLRLDGALLTDSSEIIAALERRQPDPPLYPADPAERERALALEDWFDEELGPHIRLLAWHTITNQSDSLEAVAVGTAAGPLKRFGGAASTFARTFVNARFGVNRAGRVEVARTKVREALDRLEAELGDRDYLVGDRFGVADLTAAALFYPLVTPPEGPKMPPAADAMERFRAPLKDRRGYVWVQEMFARHRRRLP
jgi:glutathione S-transferase